jgi:hypothetical protein
MAPRPFPPDPSWAHHPGVTDAEAPVTTRRRLPWVLWGVNLALLASTFTLGILNGEGFKAEDLIFVPLVALAVLTSSTVGAMVASRQPRNPIGWLFLLFPFGIALGILSEEYPRYALVTEPGALPGPEWVAWLGRWIWFTAAALPLVFLLFPTGRVPSPRWRWIQRLLIGGVAWSAVLFGLDPRPISPTVGVRLPNPLGVEALRGGIDALIAVGGVTALLSSVACFVALFVRFRRSRGEERQQLRWLAYVGAAILFLFASLFGLGFISSTACTTWTSSSRRPWCSACWPPSRR